jgi:hypothetical protein
VQFPEHECVTVQYLRAKGAQDGDLLDRIYSDFDVLLTVDSSMHSQQNWKKYPQFSTISIYGCDGSITKMLPLIPMIHSALKKIKPGQHICIP